MKNIAFLLTLFFALSFHALQAQDLQTMEFEGETFNVSQQALDSRFFGVYVKNEGQRKWQYGIYAAEAQGKSFFLEQTTSPDAIKYDWNLDNKEQIEWGLVVDKNGKPVRSKVSEVVEGQQREFESYLILVKHLQTGKVESLYLYEQKDLLCLGYACKVNEVASSGNQK